MNNKQDYSLYLVTDRALMRAPTLTEAVERAIDGGCTMVQLREKEASSREFYDTALRLRALTARRGVPLLVDDRLDIALAAGADGVHVGQSDLPAREARRLIGPDRLLGVSVSTAAEAVRAASDGADYLGVGAMYPTGTKQDAARVTMDELRRIRAAVSLPLVVIGGINARTASDFAFVGIDGFAVVSAVLASPDIRAAARELALLSRKICRRAAVPR